jgi:hypothetical protein
MPRGRLIRVSAFRKAADALKAQADNQPSDHLFPAGVGARFCTRDLDMRAEESQGIAVNIARLRGCTAAC